MLTALPAQATTPIAEVVCAPRERMVQHLTVQHRAHIPATGLRDANAMIGVWAVAKGRRTLVQGYANGQACILAMGTDWDAGLTSPA